MSNIKRLFPYIVVSILSFWSVRSLLEFGFFPMHDDTQVARVFEMGKALKDGMFPVRWVSDLGYGFGYPIFNFYAPLSYYFGGLFSLLGFDALASTKTMMILGIMLSGIFMYLLASEFFGRFVGIVSGLFYLYAPYHALDIFVRGDVSEFFAYAFIPLVFYGIVKINKTQKWSYVVISAIGLSGIIISHNLTAMMVAPFLLMAVLIYCHIAYRNKKLFTIYYLLFTIFLGLALSAFYWLPAIFELSYANIFSQIGGGADFRNHFVCIEQLWDSPWGFGGSIPGCTDGMSFKIGKLHIVLSLLALIVLVFLPIFQKIYRYNNTYHYSEKTQATFISFLGFAISIFLMLETSKTVWETIPLWRFFQYPWRFLLLASFFSSFLAGATLWFLQIIFNKRQYLNISPYAIRIIFIFLLIYFNAKLFTPQILIGKTSSDYTDNLMLKWTTSKISDEYMPADFIKPVSSSGIAREKLVVSEGSAKINYLTNKTQKVSAQISVSKEASIKLNISYFPAWKFFQNGKEISVEKSKQGYAFSLPQGNYTFEAIFRQTPIEKIANAISIIGAVMLIAGIIPQRRRKWNND